MFRVLTILAAVAALAVSAAPASAGGSKKPPPRTARDGHSMSVVVLIGANDYGLVAARDVSASPKPPGLGTPSGGEVIGADWVKAPPKPRGIVVTKHLDAASTDF